MTGYTKLFTRILDSTIWQEDNPTRILWITMLAMVDRDGLVLASIPGLAKRANISLQECEAGLAKFQEPDPYSQSQVAEGRRIEVVQGGWHLINYEAYRHQLSAAEQRDKDRLRKAQYRMSQKSGTKRDSPEMSQMSQFVPSCHDESDIAAATASASATEEEKSKPRALRAFVPPTLEEVTAYCQERANDVDPTKFHSYYTSQGWYVGKNRMRDWRAAVRTWERNGYGTPIQLSGYQKSKAQLKQEERDAERARVERIWREMDDADDVQGKPRPEPEF